MVRAKVAVVAGVPKEPPKWREVYEIVQEIRQIKDAPVDTMGCECLADKDQFPEQFRFEVLVSVMLSSQTKDALTAQAVRKLKEYGLTIENIMNTPEDKIAELISQVGFRNTKATNLRKICTILHTKYNNSVPSTLSDLLELPGIGPKMSHIILNVGFGIVSGIAVDTHVHRVCNLLGWVKTKTPEQTRIALEQWVPKDLWAEINVLFVGFGQQLQTQSFVVIQRALTSSKPQQALSLVLKLGAKIDAKHKPTHPHHTPLTWACNEGRPDLVKLLLCHKASTKTKNGARQTPLECAKNESVREVLQAVGTHKRKKMEDSVQAPGETKIAETNIPVEENSPVTRSKRQKRL